MADARLPMFHRTVTALAAFERLADAVGKSIDRARLSREDLFFLSDLRLTDDDQRFASSTLGECERDRLELLLFRASVPPAEAPSAFAASETAGRKVAVTTAAPTRNAA